jgi:hypothetical protein
VRRRAETRMKRKRAGDDDDEKVVVGNHAKNGRNDEQEVDGTTMRRGENATRALRTDGNNGSARFFKIIVDVPRHNPKEELDALPWEYIFCLNLCVRLP